MARAGGLKKLVGVNLEEIDAREVNSIRLFDDAQGREIHVRVGRFGPYLERVVVGDSGEPESQRANLPDDLSPDELTLEVAEKLFATPQEGRKLGADPVSGNEIVAKEGRFGPYVTELLPEPPPEPVDLEPVAEGERGGVAVATKAPGEEGEQGQEGPRRAEAAHRLAVQVHGPGDDHPRRGADPALAAAHGGHRPGHEARRSPRRTAATARTSSAAPTPARSPPRTSSSRSPSTRR